MIGNAGVAMLGPLLPLWMLDTMDAPKWQQGTFIYATVDEADAYMFYRCFFVFFLFFFRSQQKYQTTVLGNG